MSCGVELINWIILDWCNCEANAGVQKYIKIVVIFLLGACFVAIGMSTLYRQLIVW